MQMILGPGHLYKQSVFIFGSFVFWCHHGSNHCLILIPLLYSERAWRSYYCWFLNTYHRKSMREAVKNTEDSYDVILTNIDRKTFPTDVIKELYGKRGGNRNILPKFKIHCWIIAFLFKKGGLHISGNLCTTYNVQLFWTHNFANRNSKAEKKICIYD